MAFERISKQKYPARNWALFGRPGVGKSSLAARSRTPLLVIDADQRFGEVSDLAAGDVYDLGTLSDDPAAIDDALRAGMADGTTIGTIVVDSLTAVMAPVITRTLQELDAGKHRNKASAWRAKASAMRRIQDAVSRYQCDKIWIWHIMDSRDGSGQAVSRSTLPATERARLMRSLNLELEVVADADGRRGVRVIWARSGVSDVTVWDDSGTWQGMPELIEAAVYDQPAPAGPPQLFRSPSHAWAWAMDRAPGVFADVAHCRAAYAQIKAQFAPASAADMAARWVGYVDARRDADV